MVSHETLSSSSSSPISAETELNPGLPSGYAEVQHMPGRAVVDESVLPWIDSPQELGVARCTLASGESFLLANGVGTSDKLVKAAEGMNAQQQQNANNMFYSRLPEYIQSGHSRQIEVMNDGITASPIHVMRNKGGQRVYFTKTNVTMSDGSSQEMIIRLGACDKNRQMLIMKVLSGSSAKKTRQKMSGSK